MANLEFAILQYLEGKVRVVLKRDQDQLLERLQKRIQENLDNSEVYNDSMISKAVEKAFNGLIKEFKDETLTLV